MLNKSKSSILKKVCLFIQGKFIQCPFVGYRVGLRNNTLVPDTEVLIEKEQKSVILPVEKPTKGNNDPVFITHRLPYIGCHDCNPK